MTDRHIRRLRAAALFAATALTPLAWPMFASAQEMQPDTEIDEIVVTGQREAQRAAIAVKRAEFEVMDAVSADDIGKLPDHNTAGALRRIPGISIMEDQGEPRWPILRGLASTYNRTTIDGAVVGSVDESARTVPMDIVPSVMAGRLEVIKTVTPEHDGNAIGGVINVNTRSAFDRSDAFLDIVSSYGMYERHGDVRNDKPSYRAAFAAGRRFGVNEEWGVVVGASHEQLDYDIAQVEAAAPSVREYTAAGVPVNSGAAGGNGWQVPTQVRLFWYNNTKQRSGVNGKLEWRPSDAFRWDVSGLFARMEDDEERIEYRIEPIGNVSSQTAATGTFAQGRNTIHVNQPITQREISLARTGFVWDASDRWTLDGDLVHSRAELETPNTSIEFRGQGATFGFTYDTSDFFPIFTQANQAAVRNPANYSLVQQREDLLNTEEATTQARLNLVFDDGGYERNLKLKFGGLYRSTGRDYAATRTTYTARTGFIYTLAPVVGEGPSELIQGRYLLNPRIDVAKAAQFFEANRASFNAVVSNTNGDYEVTEDVGAAYAQGSYRVGDWTVLAGVRYERTDVESSALRNGTTPVSNSGGYDSWMPSVHVRWDVREDIVVRAAWTNTIGRPDFGSLTATETVSFADAVPTVSRGAPGLKARESQGFDLSFEFYPEDGLVSVAVFSKEIENEIFTLTSNRRLDVGRGVEDVIVSTPMNAETATIRGFEVAVQKELTFLPGPFDGLGVSANATLLDTDFTFLTSAGKRETGLYQQPEHTLNAAVWYQKGPLEARVSYNYIGGFLETINDAIPNADQYWKGRHLYDASISWRLGNGVTIFAEGQNLNDAGRREVTGPGRAYLQESAEYGRTFWLGVSASF